MQPYSHRESSLRSRLETKAALKRYVKRQAKNNERTEPKPKRPTGRD